MKCAACGTDSPSGSRFCESCGHPLGASCATCGAPNTAGARFCNQCGAAQAAPPQSAPAAPKAPPRHPIAYTPKHLADKILRTRAALEGERKQVTVLMADVKESMALSEAVDPETWHRMMDGFFEILTTVIHRFDGTINQYTGDGVMALFGAPIAHEDHAQRACYAALQLSAEFERYAREVKRTHGLGFSVRIGLNSGEVVVGKIGDDLRMDYTAKGHTVGLAARMEQLADPGKIFLTEHTAALVRGYFDLESLGEFQIKGASSPVHAYVLRSTGALRTRLDVSRSRGFSRFVGRTSETQTLDSVLDQVLTGNGQVVGVVGEAGVGKSRLCYEFIERCRARDIITVEAHCVAHGKLVPLLPMLELLRNIFGITERDTEREARRKIAGTLVLLADDVAEDLPLVFDLMGVPDPNRSAPLLDPDVRQRRIFSLVKRAVRARSEREPSVMLLDDVHWIDATSEVFLGHWVDAVQGTRTLLLLNFRPEYRADWMRKSIYQQIALQPLSADLAKSLLRELLGTDPSLEGLSDRVFDRSAGNPFFIEEIVQSLIESHKLLGERGAYRLVGSVDQLSIPATVQTILAARIDRLPEREKHVLQTAAVIGRVVPSSILKKVVELPDAEIDASVRALTDAEFLFEQSIYPEVEYAFKHPLTQEVAYGSQLADRRGRTHALVARAMIDVDGDKIDERAALLAGHWEKAGDARQAAEWHGRAGTWCGHRDSAGALYHWRSAWEQLLKLDQEPARDERVVKAGSQILYFGFRAGMSLEEISATFEHSRHLGEQLGDVASLVLLNYRYVVTAALAGAPAATLRDLVAETRLLSEKSHDPAVQLLGLYASAANAASGPLPEALVLYDAACALCADDPRVAMAYLGETIYRRALWGRAHALSAAGRIADARRDVERLRQLAVELATVEPDTLVLAHGVAIHVAWYPANPHEPVLAQAREMLAAAEKTGAPINLVYAYSMLGLAYLLSERWEDAIATAEQARAVQKTSRTAVPFESYVLAYLAQAHAELGNLSSAREYADLAVELALRFGIKRIEIHCRVVRVSILMKCTDAAARASAAAEIQAADSLLNEIGARAFEPMIDVHRAELARLDGDEAAWRAGLRKAHRLFTEMGMTGRAERVARELR